MSQYTKEWCRTFWNAMRFMEAVYARLDRSGDIDLRPNWGAGKDPDDPDDDDSGAAFFFECKVKSVTWRTPQLCVSFSIDPDGPENGYPLWLVPLEDDRELLGRLEKAFPGDVVREEDDFSIGLPLDIPPDAKEAQIVAEGNKLADRIVGVLAPA